MRGTLHFLRPDDLRVILSLTAERSLAAMFKRRSNLGLDTNILSRARQVALSALGGGHSLERAEFLDVLQAAGIDTAEQRGPHLIGYLAQTGVVCWGPRRSNQQAVVLLDEWAPPGEERGEEEALRHLAFRYFTGHGPATVKDLIWWSKVTVAQAKRALALAREDLTELPVDGISYWIGTGALAQIPPAGGPDHQVHLLPGFDEYLLGYQDRSLPLAAEHAQLIVPGNNGVFLPVIVSNGRVIGTWRRERRTSHVVITPLPVRPLLQREVRSIRSAADAYGRFLGLPVRMIQ